jgi:hypothetical protein
VLKRQNSSGKLRLILICPHFKTSLSDEWACINTSINKVHTTPMPKNPGTPLRDASITLFDDAGVGVKARKVRKKRRVNVHDSPVEL